MSELRSATNRAAKDVPGRLGIAWRLAIGSALPLLLFVAFSVWLWGSLGQVRNHVQSTLAAGVDYALQAKDLQRNVVQVQQFLSDISATRGLDGLADGFDQAKANRDQFLAGLDRFAAQRQTRQEATQASGVQTVRQDFDKYYNLGVRMAEAYVRGGPAEGNPLMDNFDKASVALQTSLDAFVSQQITQMRTDTAEVAVQLHGLRQLAVLLCAVGVLLAGLLSWRLARSITRPIQQAMQSVEKVAQGDLVTPITVSGSDEIARLLGSLDRMQTGLLHICQGVLRNAQSMAGASDQIAQSGHELSVHTQEQANSLQQTAAAMQQLGSAVTQNVDDVEHANHLAQEASSLAVQGGAVVHEFVATMKGINDSSRKIADIIGVIDGIAFQTNILALNAAVEAARAGDQGRGFAVVASEVRSLAQRSAAAAREIKTLISASVERVEQGTQQVDQAGAAMSNVEQAIAQVSVLMVAVNRATREHSQGIEQVSQAIATMERATEQNVQRVDDSDRLAGDLQTQSQQLVQAMAAFRLS